MLLKKLRWLLIAGSLSLVALGVNAQDAAVTVAFVESQPNTLDPHAARTVDEFLVIRNVCEGLTNYDPVTLEPIAALAESWTVSEDGLVYTFVLRPNVTFSDGSTLDAADVKYSFDRLSDPDLGTSYTAPLILRDVAGYAEARPAAPAAVGEGTPAPTPIEPSRAISGVSVVDEATVAITLARPVTSFITRLTLPGGVIIAEGSADAGFESGPICAGPYSVSEFVPNDRVVLTANEAYWGGAPEVKTATIRVITELSAQVIEFEAGALDVSVAPEADLPRLRDDAALNEQLVTIPVLGLYNLRVNLKDTKLGDVRVRQALAYAIDRQLVVDTVLQGQATPADFLYPVGLGANSGTSFYARDVERARELLTEAGYPDGIELTVRTDQNETENRVLNAIAATVAEAGITLNVNSTEAAIYTQDRTACTMELGGIRWTMDYPDPENMVVLVLPNAATRVNCGYGEVAEAAEIDALYIEGISLPFGEERDAVFARIEQIAIENALIIPVYSGATTRLVSSRLGGTPVDANGVVRFALIDLQ